MFLSTFAVQKRLGTIILCTKARLAQAFKLIRAEAEADLAHDYDNVLLRPAPLHLWGLEVGHFRQHCTKE